MNDQPISVRRRLGLGLGIAGVLFVAGASLYAAAEIRPPANDASAIASADETPSASATVPTASVAPEATADATEPIVPAGESVEYPGIDFSRTPAGWYDVRTPSADIVIPEYNAWGEKSDGIWEKQREITAQCMAEQGLWFAWTNDRSRSGDPTQSMFLFDDTDAAYLAHWGTNPSDQPYDWRLAGCDGYAVHVTGMDEAN